MRHESHGADSGQHEACRRLAQMPAFPPAARRMPPAARGFTLLEIMIAVGIIAVLITISAVAINVVMGNAKGRSTRVALDNCLGLQTEYELNTKLPGSLKLQVLSRNPPADALAMTLQAMETFRQTPKNKEMLDKLPGGSLVRLDLRLMQDWSNAINYTLGEIVEYPANSGILFRSKQAPNLSQTPVGDATDLYWSSYAPQFPNALADGWGNPIFCAGTALRFNEAHSSSVAYRVGMVAVSGGTAYKCIADAAPGTAVTNTASWTPVTSTPFFDRVAPGQRLVWVSAGPDNNLATDDDNIYSFEN